MSASVVDAKRGDLVSIIMPAHNSARFIAETVESVIAQTYPHWELLIVDDRSSDDTVPIVRAFEARDLRIRLTQLDANGGAAVARNTAIAQAAGRYVAFLDSDDLWLPHKLAEQIAFMERTQCPFTYASYERISEEGEPLGIVTVPDRVDYRGLLKRNVVGCLTAVYDRYHFGTTLMPMIRKGQDYGLWLQLLRRTEEARGLQGVVGRYRVQTRSISSNKLESAAWVWRLYREVIGLSVPDAAYCFAHYAVSGVGLRLAQSLRRFSNS